MSLILSVILTITFILIYSLLIQIFTALFRITGLSKEKAHFQVISLLTNSGYTTNESELILTNRSRRKLAKSTMITGNVFNVVIVSLLINILFNINVSEQKETVILLAISFAVFVFLMIFIRLPFFKKLMERLIEKIATKINDKKHKKNIITELDTYGKKSVVEVYISKLPAMLENKNIEESELKSRYNLIILLIQRNGRILDVKRDTTLQKGDRVVLFGKTVHIKEVFDSEEIKEEEVLDETIITNELQVIDNYGSNAMVEIEIKRLPEILKGQTLGQSVLKEKYNINVLMLRHEDKVILVDADTELQEGDNVILIGPYQYIKDVFINEL